MSELNETDYTEGSRRAWLTMLSECLRQLGYDSPEFSATHWVKEREATVLKLRDVCRDFGDNDWPEDLHLEDVIEKHLLKHLHERSAG